VPGTDDYVSYALSHDAANQSKLIPQLIQQTYIDSDHSTYTNYLHREIQGIMDAKTHQSSSTKYVAITSLTLKVFRMRHTGVADLIHGFKDPYNRSNKAIYTCASCQNCCVLEAIFIARKPDEYRSLKGNPRQILARMLGQYYDLFEKPMTLPFAGVDAASTLLMVAKKYNFSFSLFKREPKFADDDTTPPVVFQDAITPPDLPTPPKHFNLLCCSSEVKQHVMFIKSIDDLAHFHICPHCKIYLLTRSSYNHHKERFNAHVAKCDGKFHPRPKLELYNITLPSNL
jgi:hypothetical protein